MPLGNSIIIAKDNTEIKASSYGCSEFPALMSQYTEYSPLGILIFSKFTEFGIIRTTLDKYFGKEYSTKKYLEDYILMILEMLKPINDHAKKQLFKPFTVEDAIKSKSNLSSYLSFDGENDNDRKLMFTGSMTYFKDSAGEHVKFDASDVIGITVDCSGIRSMVNQKTDRCRKIQIAHTALRLIYSSGWPMALMSLKMYKDGIRPLYAFWMASRISNALSLNHPEYGELFTSDCGFLSEDTFIKRVVSSELNGTVQGLFAEESNELLKTAGLSQIGERLDIVEILKFPIKSQAQHSEDRAVIGLKIFEDPKYIEKVTDIINSSLEKLKHSYDSIDFKFTKKLFRSTEINVKYSGIIIPGPRLERIIFKDEDEVALSVLTISKFIEV